MSRVCSVCQKGKMDGHKVSHSNIKTNRKWEVNLQKVKVASANGATSNEYVCAKCLKSGKVNRV